MVAVLSAVAAGPRHSNFDASFRMFSILVTQSFLFKMTTPDPLSGRVIKIFFISTQAFDGLVAFVLPLKVMFFDLTFTVAFTI